MFSCFSNGAERHENDIIYNIKRPEGEHRILLLVFLSLCWCSRCSSFNGALSLWSGILTLIVLWFDRAWAWDSFPLLFIQIGQVVLELWANSKWNGVRSDPQGELRISVFLSLFVCYSIRSIAFSGAFLSWSVILVFKIAWFERACPGDSFPMLGIRFGAIGTKLWSTEYE